MKLWTSLIGLVLASGIAVAAPLASLPYQRDLTREARAVWGLNAPVPVFGAQIQQESGWKPDVCSAFACGLAQFTPSTAKWISGLYPKDLAGAAVFNPQWAMRALVRYDRNLYNGTDASFDCDHWAFTLSAYNGGLGNLHKDIRLCSASAGCDPKRWFGHVAEFTARAPIYAKENRGYPQRILLLYQPSYTTWGAPVSCSQQH